MLTSSLKNSLNHTNTITQFFSHILVSFPLYPSHNFYQCLFEQISMLQKNRSYLASDLHITTHILLLESVKQKITIFYDFIDFNSLWQFLIVEEGEGMNSLIPKSSHLNRKFIIIYKFRLGEAFEIIPFFVVSIKCK